MLWIGLALALAAPQDKPDPIERFTTDNGLTVLLRPLKGAKHTALVVLFNIGGDHDPRGKSGLAHLVEHVYVTAAAGKEPARTVEQYLARYKHGWNAQTGDRYTVVATVFEAAQLERELADAAARMGDLKPDAADLDRERPRLLEEIDNMFGGIPLLGAINHARELVRPTPNDGRKGGSPGQVRSITLDDVRTHWRRYYKPRNAVLVLAGGFEAAAARQSVTAAFGALPGGDASPAPSEPGKPALEKAKIIDVKSREPAHAGVAYAAPLPDSDLYAPFLLVAMRLFMAMPRSGTLQVHCPMLDDPAMAGIIDAQKPHETAPQTLDRLRAFVAKAIEPGLNKGEGSRAIDMLGLRDAPDAMLAMAPYGVAFGLGRRHQLGIDAAKLRDALKGVTDDDLRRVAREVFAPERSGGVVVTPRDD